MNKLQKFHQTEAVQQLLAAIDAQQEIMLETVIHWSKINSGSFNMDGLKVMEKEILDAFKKLDCQREIVPLSDGTIIDKSGHEHIRKNGNLLRFYKRPDADRKILFTGHYDTVFGTDHPFQDINWLDDDTLNGPGVADMKGGIIVILYALIALEKSPFANGLGWEVLLSPDEETGSLASAPYLVERAPHFDLGMTYEPAMADGTLAGFRKGSGNFTIVVDGLAAHAGREFHLGKNAVVALSDIISQLAALSGQREGLTVNPAVISGGSANNVVPDRAMCSFNVRLEKSNDVPWLEAKLTDIINNWNKTEGYNVTLYGGINRPPKELSPANLELMRLIKECGAIQNLSIDYIPTGGCCEGNNLAAAGLPNVDTLGVRGGKIHSSDEFLITKSLSERAKLSAFITMAVAENFFDSIIPLKNFKELGE